MKTALYICTKNKMKMNKIIALCLFLHGFLCANAQNYKLIKQNEFCKIVEIDAKTATQYDFVNGNFNYTSFSINAENENILLNLVAISNQKSYKLNQNKDITLSNEFIASNVQIFNEPQSDFSLKTAGQSGLVVVSFFYAPTLAHAPPVYTLGSAGCMEPPTIPQSVWRAGLPAPLPNPTPTAVAHTVVHHTASNNSVTNYTDAVRNIYLYHTQTNGWDDIGYNYLVAPDGTIFTGRDPQGAATQDNIRGAHFCAKNTNTMGVALIGDYMLQEPDSNMMKSLTKLLLWKLYKEQLNPTDSTLHPVADPNALLLPVVCGHQDGCATDCPGIFVYNKIVNLRLKLAAELLFCLPINITENNFLKLVATIDQNKLTLRQKGLLTILNTQGETVLRTATQENQVLDLSHLPQGIYILKQLGVVQKIIIY